MAARRVTRRPAKRTSTRRRVKVMPFVVPTRQSAAELSPLVVPTKWVKFIFALFLLPLCTVLSQTFFTSFARATVAERLWAGEEFWFFSLGVVLWLIAFFGLPRPIVLYVFGHELTHALWVWLMGGRVSHFRVGREGGHILTDKNNFLIALAPYFFPIYSILVLALYGGLSLFVNVQPYGRLLYALLGATWAFHFTFTCWMIPKSQSDLRDQGTFFSLVIIYLMNLIVLSVLLVLASKEISFADFGAEVGENVNRLLGTIGTMFDRFSRGASAH
jgi:hypothetical protein